MVEKIRHLAGKYAAEFIEVRHQLHANPELSYEEYETSRFHTAKVNCLADTI
jgi:metal-dependent amidase/aminoacylase/carboxypeptidase family protein